MELEAKRELLDEQLCLVGELDGHLPVQGFGTVRGLLFYFRARYDSWSFAIATDPSTDPEDIYSNAQGFYCAGKHANAGYMPYTVAEAHIKECCAAYLGGSHA